MGVNLSDTIEYTEQVHFLASFPARNLAENGSFFNQHRFDSGAATVDSSSGKEMPL